MTENIALVRELKPSDVPYNYTGTITETYSAYGQRYQITNWYHNGKLHRDGGKPAVEKVRTSLAKSLRNVTTSRSNEWYLNGQKVTQAIAKTGIAPQEKQSLIKLRGSLSIGEDFTAHGSEHNSVMYAIRYGSDWFCLPEDYSRPDGSIDTSVRNNINNLGYSKDFKPTRVSELELSKMFRDFVLNLETVR